MYNLIYLADDHAIVAAGIAHLLRSLTNTREVNVFHSGNEILAAIEQRKPSLIILDIEMPGMNGIETLQKIKSATNVPVIMLSMNDEKYIIRECMNLGANGFLAKDCNIAELNEAIDVVMDGGTYMGEKISFILETKKAGADNFFELLSPVTKRELQILEFICDGMTCKEIADKLYLSNRTVEAHKKSIMAKFDAHTTGKLVSLAVKHKYVK